MFGLLKPRGKWLTEPIPVPDTPQERRTALRRFKAQIGQAVPIKFQPESRWERILFSILMKRYLRYGPMLWNHAYALTKSLPERERQREMAEIRRLLEGAGLPEPAGVESSD